MKDLCPRLAHDMGSSYKLYNVLIEWESGEITWEPLQLIASDDPVTCALYAKEKDLLNKTGRKRFKQIKSRNTRKLSSAWHVKPSSDPDSVSIHGWN